MNYFSFISIFLFNNLVFYDTYNIDINSPYVKSNPLNSKGYFGFSVNIFTVKQDNIKYFLVGAPFDNLKNLNHNNTGALYSCPITIENADCTQFSFSEQSDESLLGYVVDSNSEDGSIYTCAPRFLRTYSYVKYTEGACWEFNNMFKEVEPIVNNDCLDSIKSNSQNYEYRNCLTGGSLKSLNNKQLVLTSPYSYEGKGLLIYNNFYSRDNSRSSYFLKFENSMSKYQLTGFSISVGKIFRKADVKTIILGTPGIAQYNTNRTDITFGQVVFIQLNKNIMQYSGKIFGEIFGSGYGYSVLAMDLDNDGYDELVVGAPFANNNNGLVFVYWNREISPQNNNGYSIPFSVTNRLLLSGMKKIGNGQYGISLENIGDINKDSIMDLAIGAPFDNEGTGSVFIYLGNRNQILTLSQKVEGKMISPDLRGFGFSLFGKNEDLDSNSYPDFIVGSVISGHVVGLRTRPIIRVYAENMVDPSNMQLSYSLDNLKKCDNNGQLIDCIDLKVSIYYYYPNLSDCPSYATPKEVDYNIDLDLPFLQNSYSKRIYFEDKTNTMTERITVYCKQPNTPSTSTKKSVKILIPFNLFFNISVPIEIQMRWSINLTDAPKRNFHGGDLSNLSYYPVLEKSKNSLVNKIYFGAGCTPESCQPILTMRAILSLPKDGEQFILHIGNVTKFKLDIPIKNIATSDENKAYRTYLKLDYDSKAIILSTTNSDRKTSSQTGLIYSVKSPLHPKQTENTSFECTLSNDFILNAKGYLFIHISLEAMSPQRHLKPIILKIRIKMVANIDLKVSVSPDNYRYQENPLLGFDGITSEEKIGPKMKFSVSLENNVQNSVVVASKLLIYFPWEIAGNPNEADGQYLLYLLRTPKFSVTTGNKKIQCNANVLNNITNIIKTRIYQNTIDNPKLEDVMLKKVSVPKNAPKLPKITEELKFISKESNSEEAKSEWENIVSIDCMEGSARCVPIVCSLGPLSRQSGEITLELDIRIWEHTLVENFLKYKFVYIDIPVYWVPLVDYDIVLKDSEGSFRKVRVVAANLQKPKPPASLDMIYAIIIAVSVGVLLLATIVIILYQCKFFQRQKIGKRKRKQRI